MNQTAWKSLGFALAVSAATAFLHHATVMLDPLERWSADFRLSLRADRAPHPDIVVVDIDKPSLQGPDAIGIWPWPRRIHGEMIDRLTKAGAKCVIFDVMFLEEDKARPESDAALGRAAERSGRVVFGCLYESTTKEPGAPWDFSLPIDALARPGVAVGLVNVAPEDDGVLRAIPLSFMKDDIVLPSLSLAAAGAALGRPPEEVLAGLAQGGVPVDERGYNGTRMQQALLNYVGGPQSFPYYSYVDVHRGRVPPETFKDKIVMIGGTAQGMFDYTAVPMSSKFPGLEIQATAVDNILQGNFLRQPPAALTLILVLLFGLLCGGLGSVFPLGGALMTLGVLLVYFLTAQTVFSRHNLLLDLAAPSVGALGSYLAVLFYRFKKERKEKQKLRATFSQYMAPEVVEVVMKMDLTQQLGGEDREMTVFFSDLAGFTSISESMTPKELVSVLNEYLTEMSEVIFRYGGIVDKFIGDAIMAFWNAPLDQPNHAQLACFTALDQVEKLKALQKRFAERKLPEIDFRAGINTGHMVVGNMGSSQRKDYTVMGDSVNLASRLEGANKPFHTRLMISEFTYARAKDDVEVRPLDLLRVKGKSVPIQVYELAGRKGQLTPDQAKAFAAYGEGMAFYREKRFEKAIDAFKRALAVLPGDGPARLYVERSESFIAFPPPAAWDGVYVMTSK